MEFKTRQEELEYRFKLLSEQRKKNLPKTNLFQTLVGKFAAYFTNKPLWFDFSDYQPKVNYPKLQGRVSGIMQKMFEVDDQPDNTNFSENNWTPALDGAYMRYPVIGYCFVNTAWYLNHQHNNVTVENWFKDGITDDDKMNGLVNHDLQLRWFVRSLAIGDLWTRDISALKDGRTHFRACQGLSLDVERWWLSYNEYYANQSTARKVSDFWIGWVTKWLYEKLNWMMDRGYLPKIPIIIYSGKWFIQTYSPLQLGTFVETHDSWVAGYYWNTGGTMTTIEKFKSDYLSLIPDSWRPGLFGSIIRFYQITGDRFKIPEVTNLAGIPVAIDINVSTHTQEQDYAWLNYTSSSVVVPPIPEPEPKNEAVVLVTINIRKAPGATNAIIDTKFFKDKQLTYISEQTLANGEVWMQVDLGQLGTGWICEGQGTTQYINKV